MTMYLIMSVQLSRAGHMFYISLLTASEPVEEGISQWSCDVHTSHMMCIVVT